MEANLGPGRVRWSPTTEAEVVEAVETAIIAESHYIDVKREVGDTPSKRKETAKDLASFGIDGGALLIGVEENKQERTFSVFPQPLEGLIERIENVAATAIDPPLNIVATEIACEQDPKTGYVLVCVPPSPFAPYMTNGRYYARGERTTRVLSDAEVVRLHGQRDSIEARIGGILDREIAREPVLKDQRELGHLYLVAEPVGAPRNIAHNLVRNDRKTLTDVIWNRQPELRSSGLDSIPPQPHDYASQTSRRSMGTAFHSHSLSGPGRTVVSYPGEESIDDGLILDIEVRDNGALRILVGRLTARVPRNFTRGEDEVVIMDSLALAYVRRMIRWVVEIGRETGWRGSWMLGIHGDRLRGSSSVVLKDPGILVGQPSTFDEDHYREVTTAAHLEMEQRPGSVASRLVGRLTEALGSTCRLQGDLQDEVP